MKIRKIRNLCLLAVIIAVAGAAVYIYTGRTEPVKAVSVEKGNLQDYIEVRGKVDLAVKNKIFSQLPALVKTIDAAEGDRVNGNTQLAELYADSLDNAPEITALAVSDAENTVRNLSANIIPERLKAYELTKEQYDKNKASYTDGSLSLVELQASESAMNAAAMALEDVRFQLNAAKMSVDRMKLQKKDVETDLGKIKVVSGISGTVLAKYVDEGSGVEAGMPLFEVGDINSAYVRVDVPAEDAVRIRPGQTAQIYGGVTGGRIIKGKVYYIAPKAEAYVTSLGVEQQRVEIRISFDNSSFGLKPGYGADVRIITLEKHGLYVPNDSVFDSNGKNSVFVVVNGRLELRSINTGIENNNSIEVVGGLSEKDSVVSDFKNSLKPGMKVRISP